jgi:hypothetical protein
MAKIFIAGHGRMVRSGGMAVPSGVTVSWAVPPRFNGSGGLSTAYLSGRYSTWAGKTAASEPFYEHYLCPDLNAIMVGKALAMREANWPSPGGYYLMQPRLKFTVTLSSILQFLKRRVPGPWDVYWTCCRSPISEPSFQVRYFEDGLIRDEVAGGSTVPTPDKSHELFRVSQKGKLLDPRDLRNIKLLRNRENVIVNDIDGGVTLKCLTDGDFTAESSWPGVVESERPTGAGRARSGSMSGSIV